MANFGFTPGGADDSDGSEEPVDFAAMMAQMQQHLLLRKYDGFMKKGRVRFRGRQATQGF